MDEYLDALDIHPRPLYQLYSPKMLGFENTEFLFVFAVFYSQLNITKRQISETPLFVDFTSEGQYEVDGMTLLDDDYNVIGEYNQNSIKSNLALGVDFLNDKVNLSGFMEYYGFISDVVEGYTELDESWKNSMLFGSAIEFANKPMVGLDTWDRIHSRIEVKGTNSSIGGLGDFLSLSGTLKGNRVFSSKFSVSGKLWGTKAWDDDEYWAEKLRKSVGGGSSRLVDPEALIVRGWSEGEFKLKTGIGANIETSLGFGSLFGGSISSLIGADFAYISELEDGDKSIFGTGLELKWENKHHLITTFCDLGFNLNSSELRGLDIGVLYKRIF